MSTAKRRLLLIFSGRMMQPELDHLRATLDLSRMGRLTDREDEHFGTRQLHDSAEGAAMLNLWRADQASWYLTIDATPEHCITDTELNAWEQRVYEAANQIELSFIERRSFQNRKNLGSETEWRNENWLRTTGWDLPANTLEELWAVLSIGPKCTSADRRIELTKFMESPSWEAAPSRFKQEAKDFLDGHHGG
ncbi:hypothetical protein [Nocardia sp. R6R-6]|uniref:hypothetical protein n=1 Tax=Nocardia sp. R6R-6 TaxID=3459303 RepID=UPI00403D7F00